LKHQIGSLRSEGNTMRERMPPEQRKVDPASELMGTQMEHRQRIREQWKKDAGDLIDAHMFATSVVANMTSRISGRRFERQSKEIEGRLTLTAQFIQGIEICEVAISEALYSQAAALLKQELETLAAIDEFEKVISTTSRTPRGTTSLGMLSCSRKAKSAGRVPFPNTIRNLPVSSMGITSISSSRSRCRLKESFGRYSTRASRRKKNNGFYQPP
jgi:hypothetical protein